MVEVVFGSALSDVVSCWVMAELMEPPQKSCPSNFSIAGMFAALVVSGEMSRTRVEELGVVDV